MLVQLKCKTCNSELKLEPNGKTFVCDVCGSRYIFTDEEKNEIIDIQEIISEGNKAIQNGDWYTARYCFGLYMQECALPYYEAYLGYILTAYECRSISQLAKVESSYYFESDEWKTLLEISNSHKAELLKIVDDSRTNFNQKLDTNSKRHDAETILADEVYMMGIAEIRRQQSNDYDLLKLCNDNDVFQTFPNFTRFIVCSAKGTRADYFESALKETEGAIYPDKVLLFAPDTGIENKSTFLEEMYEYHMRFNIDLTVAFVNDNAKLQRLARYGRCSSGNIQFPNVGWGLDGAYIKGDKIVLIGGDYESANREPVSFESVASIPYPYVNPYTEEQLLQLKKIAEEQQRKIEEENELERKRLANVEQKALWIKSNLCRHCGGEFEGFLFKKCVRCGKNKDY